MKQSILLKMLTFSLGVSFLLLSCNSGGGNESAAPAKDSTAMDTSAMKAPEPAPAAQVSKVLFIKQNVANYDKWKKAYDAHDSARLANGLTNFIIGRGMKDPNAVLVILKMDDVDKGKAFSESTDLKTKMKEAGVIGKPDIQFIDVVMNDTTKIDLNGRLMVTHKVKDWDTWKKVFDDHKQARMDAGLIDRGLGYSDGDNHTVTIIFAVNDKKKADTFLNSKDLKAKMDSGGVVGPPTTFYYNIVQKY
jgi:hypothetical protein